MLVGKIKKEIRKAISELIQEGILAEVVNEVIENAKVVYDPKNKTITISFKKEF